MKVPTDFGRFSCARDWPLLGAPRGFIRRIWRPLLQNAGLQYFKFHAARHAGNSLLIAQGEDPLSVSHRMGHVDTRMTFDTYGHLFDDGRRSAQRMESALNEAGIDPAAFGLPVGPNAQNPRRKRRGGAAGNP